MRSGSYIAARADDRYASSTENNGILLDLHNNRCQMGHGIEALNAKDPLAGPVPLTTDDVKGLPPVVISVNECDPLRDEGIAFYRLLLQSVSWRALPARMGTIHGTEIFAVSCLDISATRPATSPTSLGDNGDRVFALLREPRSGPIRDLISPPARSRSWPSAALRLRPG